MRRSVASWLPPAGTALLFGSFARADGADSSDIDLLVRQPVTASGDTGARARQQRWEHQRVDLPERVQGATGDHLQALDEHLGTLRRRWRAKDPIAGSGRAGGAVLTAAATADEVLVGAAADERPCPPDQPGGSRPARLPTLAPDRAGRHRTSPAPVRPSDSARTPEVTVSAVVAALAGTAAAGAARFSARGDRSRSQDPRQAGKPVVTARRTVRAAPRISNGCWSARTTRTTARSAPPRRKPATGRAGRNAWLARRTGHRTADRRTRPTAGRRRSTRL